MQNSAFVKTVELLAPAKDYASAVAAVDYGADAVYIGGAKFGARQAAGNSAEEIARVVEYACRYGVRVHAALNTLVWDDELEEAERQARELIAAGVDALIVQDMALRRMSLPVELHASTQVCNSTPEGARFLGEAGFARVILERNLSLDEIRAICSATAAEVECFVHGAICVGFSGRCFLSRSMSGRSGNRGACSQPCRLAWDLTDGRGRTYIAGKHLLSVRDMNLSHRIGDLLDAGVTSFKIEGRLKDTNYIKNVVAYYRRAVDEALAVRPGFVRSSAGESVPDFTPDPSKSFTRGESEYFFAGKRPGVASFDTPKAVGEYVGRVAKVFGNGFTLLGEADLAPGDGICFITPHGVTGTNVNAAEGRRIVPNRMEGIVAGAEVYRNSDRLFNLRLERSRTRRVIPATAVAEVSAEGFDLYRLRGRHGFGRAHRAARPGEESRSQCRGVACAGDEVGRHDFCSAGCGGAGCGVVRAGVAGRRGAPRSALRIGRGAPEQAVGTPHPARKSGGAVSFGAADGRGERHQPAGRGVLPRPRGAGDRTGAGPRADDRRASGDAFGLLHPPRDRRVSPRASAAARRPLSGARRAPLPAGIRLRGLRNVTN